MLGIDLNYAKFIFKMVMLEMPLHGAGQVDTGYPKESEFTLFKADKLLN